MSRTDREAEARRLAHIVNSLTDQWVDAGLLQFRVARRRPGSFRRDLALLQQQGEIEIRNVGVTEVRRG